MEFCSEVGTQFGPVAGVKVGIIILGTSHPLLPGNVQNATTFNFPVIYEIVEGIDFSALMAGDPSCDYPIQRAIKRLEGCGVAMIFGACGSFAHWQAKATEYASVPVYLSIMAQVPFVLAGLPAAKKLGVVFATTDAFTPNVLTQCSIASEERLVVFGADELAEFRALFAPGSTVSDGRALQSAFVELCVRKHEEFPEIGAWLLQCSELPVYAAALQQATGLPVYDQSLLISSQFQAINRQPY